MNLTKSIFGFLAISGMTATLLSPPKFQAKDQLTEEEEIAAAVPDDPFYHDSEKIRKAGERLGISDKEVIKQRKKAMAAIMHPDRFGDDLARSKDETKLADRKKAMDTIQTPLVPLSFQFTREELTQEENAALDAAIPTSMSTESPSAEIVPWIESQP